MNDVTTREAVCWILDRMGFKKIVDQIRNGEQNLDPYINYIKYRDTQNQQIRDFINYYL